MERLGKEGERVAYRMWHETGSDGKVYVSPKIPIVVRSYPTCIACGEAKEDTTSPLCLQCLDYLHDGYTAHVPADEMTAREVYGPLLDHMLRTHLAWTPRRKSVWQPANGIGRDFYRLGWWTGDAWRRIFVLVIVKPIHALCCVGVGLLHALRGVAADFLEDER